MPTMGVIGCTVLSNELTYLVARDPDVHTVVVVDNDEGRKLLIKLRRARACESLEPIMVDRLGSRWYDDDELLIWVNPSDMHNSQERMRNTMTAEIMLMSESVDCILLLYGQCRCQTLDIAALEEETEVPILYLVDHNNVVVDDCISAIMGSSERYLRTMMEFKGAFFITPGYVDGYTPKMESDDLVGLMDEIERMTIAFEAMGNPSLIKLDNQIEGGKEYHDMIDMFARTFGLEVHTIPCDLSVFDDSYDWAKNVMRARTRGKEPVVIVSNEMAAIPPPPYRMWEELDR
ncbi:MAG: DUF1638 domain-containing protein [Methanomassiliicoccus sp.]|nr:DUF1638 domain-containing protein [Methanomassiliicoccus sp.]